MTRKVSFHHTMAWMNVGLTLNPSVIYVVDFSVILSTRVLTKL
jgi:hypothetical protein